MVCSEEDEGIMIDDEDMLSGEQATRRRSEAISQNDEMKLLWKELQAGKLLNFFKLF